MLRKIAGCLKVCPLFLATCLMATHAGVQETPRATIQAAIKAHGGEENLAKTLTGSLTAKATFTFAANMMTSFTWEESFELPRRYYRNLKGKFMEMDFSMEYAITDGSGWIRQNGGDPKEYKGEKMPVHRNWNAFLAILPSCLAEGMKLEAAGNEVVEGREAVAVKVTGEGIGGEGVLFFDKKSGLLVKAKKRMQHPLSRQETEGEVVYSDFKEVSGVQYPRRITASVSGKKISDMEITRIQLLKKIDDRLFDKP